MKIAMFCPNWVGDLVMATPALRAVRNRYPRAEIIGIMRPYLSDVLDGTGLIDRELFYDPRGANPAQRGWSLSRQLRYEDIDLALLFTNSFRTAMIAWAGRIDRRVGFARDARRWLLTDALKPKSRRTPHPVIDEYWRLAAYVGAKSTGGTAQRRQMELATSSDDELRFQRILARIGSPEETRGLVCLNSGGAFGAAKHWPTSSFAELGRLIADKFHKQVLVLCGPAEQAQAREIVRLAGHPHVVSLAGESPSLRLTKAAIRQADLLVTTDSGPRHFAAPFNVPVVTIFGPTHIAWSETFYPKAVHLQLQVDCGPCQKRVCPLGHHRCMQELGVDRVFSAVTRQLHETARRSVA